MASVGSGFSMRKIGVAAVVLCASSCSGDQSLSSSSAQQRLEARPSPLPKPSASSAAQHTETPPTPARESEGARNPFVARAYAAELARRPELTFTELKQEIALRRADDKSLS